MVIVSISKTLIKTDSGSILVSFYVEKVVRKSGSVYHLVKDTARNGVRKREYHTFPKGTAKAQAEKICCQMELEAEFGPYVTKERGQLHPRTEGCCLCGGQACRERY